MRYKFIDLFAGLGGFHLALSRLGCECVFASELRADLRKLYKVNFPGVPLNDDITKIHPEDVPPHDILCGGFPCQPFSQAGKRQGFYDEKNRGNLFNYICNIVDYHKPRYIILENVSNLKGHDNGNTWDVISHRLDSLGYDVKESIISPHEFGIPQHRGRIYIVGINRSFGNLDEFNFPQPTKEKCDIRSIIDENDADFIKLKDSTREQLSVWQEFIDNTIKSGQNIPTFPIWAMEFGATYDYSIAPAFQSIDMLVGKRGQLGKEICGTSVAECLSKLPPYSRSSRTKSFPQWKIRYIAENRNFYQRNKSWLKDWMKKVEKYENSHLKFEWNCGKTAEPILQDKIIQFRASGIRVKLPTYAPALNLVGTQVPIIPWVKLPIDSIKPGEPEYGRYLTVSEAAKLQGMDSIDFISNRSILSQNRAYEALGNAVNVDVVYLIAKSLLKHE